MRHALAPQAARSLFKIEFKHECNSKSTRSIHYYTTSEIDGLMGRDACGDGGGLSFADNILLVDGGTLSSVGVFDLYKRRVSEVIHECDATDDELTS